jgi:hypothetical protein
MVEGRNKTLSLVATRRLIILHDDQTRFGGALVVYLPARPATPRQVSRQKTAAWQQATGSFEAQRRGTW